MSNTQALQLNAARAVSITPNKLAQRKQYLADQERLAELACAIEAEALASNQVSGDEAQWEIGDGAFKLSCKLNINTRRMLVAVTAGGESIVVLRDDNVENFIYNRPEHARWLDFLITQHEDAQALRDVMAAQKQTAKNAADIRRQGLI